MLVVAEKKPEDMSLGGLKKDKEPNIHYISISNLESSLAIAVNTRYILSQSHGGVVLFC